MTTTFRAHVGKLCEIVDAHAGAPFDVQQLFARYTLDSIGQIGFGVEIGCLDDKEGQDEERKAFAAAFDTSTNLIGNRFVDPLWKIKRLLARTPLARGYEAELRKAIAVVNAWSKKIIAERRNSSDVASRTDILSRFMTTTAGDDTALRDVVINFILAGRDTTAILLTWTMYELSSKPHVVAKLRAEAARAKREGERLEADGGFGFSALTRMPYLKATLTEVLRLHPSVPLDFKAATADDTLPDGTRLKKGERVMFVAWSMGRDATIWERPDEFDPLRFIDAEGNFRFPPMASFPSSSRGRAPASARTWRTWAPASSSPRCSSGTISSSRATRRSASIPSGTATRHTRAASPTASASRCGCTAASPSASPAAPPPTRASSRAPPSPTPIPSAPPPTTTTARR